MTKCEKCYYSELCKFMYKDMIVLDTENCLVHSSPENQIKLLVENLSIIPNYLSDGNFDPNLILIESQIFRLCEQLNITATLSFTNLECTDKLLHLSPNSAESEKYIKAVINKNTPITTEMIEAIFTNIEDSFGKYGIKCTKLVASIISNGMPLEIILDNNTNDITIGHDLKG